MNSYAKEIAKILYAWGDSKNNFLIAISDVWIPYHTCDLNITIENGRVFVLTDNGYKYSIYDFGDYIKFGILCALQDYVKSVKEMLNSQENLDISY